MVSKGVFFFTLLNATISFAQFKEVSRSVKIDHVFRSPLLMGGGVAFIDFNDDGFDDIYAPGGAGRDKLYLNLGDGTFYDYTTISGITAITNNVFTNGVIAGDIDNDGCNDLFLTTSSNVPNLLLKNNCDGTFLNISSQANILEESFSMSAAFLDFNLDGFLDIYVVNYVDTSRFIKDDQDKIIGFDHTCYPSLFYVNNGDGTFDESATALGIDDIGCGLAVLSTDYDLDGDQDIYIANDFGEWVQPNVMLRNNYPEESFTRVSNESGLSIGVYGMGIANGDYDYDGDLDYYITNIGRNVFLENQGTESFIDVTSELNVENQFTKEDMQATSWGTFFFDYDNDFDLDLFVSNGFISSAEFLKTDPQDRNVLYQYDAQQNTYVDISQEYGINNPFINRGAAYADYDVDGDLDYAVASIESNARTEHTLLYRNDYTGDNNWLAFKLEGSSSNPNAFGAVITLYVNNKSVIRELSSGGPYCSQHSLIQHFGLAEHRNVDSVRVQWNVNSRQTYLGVPVNNYIFLKEGDDDFYTMGCMNSEDENYNPEATLNYQCSDLKELGCLDPEASNYDPSATIESFNCKYNNVISDLTSDPEMNIIVYPNPTVGILNFVFENLIPGRVIVYDISGHVVLASDIKDSNPVSIDLSALKNGLYYLNLLKGNIILKKEKIVKL